MDISYAVLSGGQAKRFGSDKTKALYKGKPLYLYGIETGLSLSSDVMLISKDSSKYQPYLKNVQYLQDDLGEICPMSGLIKVGMSAKYDDIFILSADAPLIEKEFVKFLYSSFNNCDGVIPVINGKSYTLMGFYKRKVLLNMLDDYNNKNFKIIKSLEKYNIKYINEDIIFSSGFNDTMFTNINFQEDLNKLEENNG
ncbi:MAG: molybdenum cofactor guanylyltransferase [Mucispirillum sp.]|uniref:Molybdenum cofactor guanylyltransferase n=1 Tax=Candidatus Mucispirillum faecigallinarum TaxID=2838699 RepID=A0A9D2GTJ0_9BACT|nr:molybdenum cofactor guanylyltransferase [Mucispirillum sp.]HIZ89102.1 molybdenum cofactor guanylyltransferase [Candidatus Mucispirillum faecigallinarum]